MLQTYNKFYNRFVVIKVLKNLKTLSQQLKNLSMKQNKNAFTKRRKIMTTKLYRAKIFNKWNNNEIAEICFYCAFTAQFDIRHEKYKNLFIIEKGNEAFYKEIREYKNSKIETYNNNKKQISVKNIADFEDFVDRCFSDSGKLYNCDNSLHTLIKQVLNNFDINIVFLNENYYQKIEQQKLELSLKITRELAEKARQTEREKRLNFLSDSIKKLKESIVDSIDEFLENVEYLRNNERPNFIFTRNEYFRKLDFLENINDQLSKAFC